MADPVTDWLTYAKEGMQQLMDLVEADDKAGDRPENVTAAALGIVAIAAVSIAEDVRRLADRLDQTHDWPLDVRTYDPLGGR